MPTSRTTYKHQQVEDTIQATVEPTRRYIYRNGKDPVLPLFVVGAVPGLETAPEEGYFGGLSLVMADVDLDIFIEFSASLCPWGDNASNSLTSLVFDSLTL